MPASVGGVGDCRGSLGRRQQVWGLPGFGTAEGWLRHANAVYSFKY